MTGKPPLTVGQLTDDGSMYWTGSEWRKVLIWDTDSPHLTVGQLTDDGSMYWTGSEWRKVLIRDTDTPSHAQRDESGAEPSRWQFAGATLFTLAVASTIGQFLARQVFAPDLVLEYGENGWSTGGLVALLGSIYTAMRCRTWKDWRRRIGVLAAVVVALAFLVVYLNTSSIQAEDLAGELNQDPAAASALVQSPEAPPETMWPEYSYAQTWMYLENRYPEEEGRLRAECSKLRGFGNSFSELSTEASAYLSVDAYREFIEMRCGSDD